MEFTHKPSELQEREQAQIKVEVESEDEPEQTTNQINNYNLVWDRQRRTIRALDRYGHADMVYYAFTTSNNLVCSEPNSYKEMLKRKDKQKWIKATDE